MDNKTRWLFHIDNMFMKQDITAQIEQLEDGGYMLYAVTSKGLKPFPDEILNTLDFDGTSLKLKIASPDSPLAKLEVIVKFSDETAEGYFKIPIIGKLKFKGEKVEVTDLAVINTEAEKEAEEKEEEAAEEENA